MLADAHPNFTAGASVMPENIIAFYHRRLANERIAADTASTAPVRTIHEQFILFYEELLQLERFGVDTRSLHASTIAGLPTHDSADLESFVDHRLATPPPLRRTA